MTIPISHVVNVNLTLAASAVALKGFGQLLMLTDEISPTMPLKARSRKYATLAEVEVDWAIGTEAYNAALPFFAQNASEYSVGLASPAATAAELTGGNAHSILADIKLITAGGFTISVDGTPEVLAALDFSSAADLAACATVVDTALSGAVCTYDLVAGTFVITSSTTGATSILLFPTADVGGTVAALALSVGASIFNGVAIETPAEALAAINADDDSFYGVVLNKKWRDDAVLTIAVATWVEASQKMFFNTSNDPVCITNGTTDIITALQAMTLDRTLSSYSSTGVEYPSSSVAGRAFIVNFEGTNTTITLNLKQGPTITVESMTTAEKTILEGKSGNAFVVIAGSNMYSDSRLASGKWFDSIHGTDWLKNRIETDVFNVLFQSTTKIPYTDAGVSVIRQAVEGALRQGVTNGLIAPGNNLLGVYMPLGYIITIVPVSDASTADKNARLYRGMSFEAAGAGAIQKVIITGDFNG